MNSFIDDLTYIGEYEMMWENIRDILSFDWEGK